MATPKKFFLLGFFFFLFGIFSWGIFQKTLATDTTATSFYSKVNFSSKSGIYSDSQNISAGDTLRVKNAIAVNSGNSDVKFKTDSFSLQNGNWVTAPFFTSKTISSEVIAYKNGSTSSLSGNFSLDPQGNLVRLKISPIFVANGNRDVWQYSSSPSILENVSDKINFFSSTGASIGTEVGSNRQIYLEAQVEAVCTVPSGYTLSTPTAYNGNGTYVFQGENVEATANIANGTKIVTLTCGINGGVAIVSAINIFCNTGYEPNDTTNPTGCVLSNQAPIATDDSNISIDINNEEEILDVLANDTDPENDDLRVSSIRDLDISGYLDLSDCAEIDKYDSDGKIKISEFDDCQTGVEYYFQYSAKDTEPLYSNSATVTVNFTASSVDLVAIDRENFSTDIPTKFH